MLLERCGGEAYLYTSWARGQAGLLLEPLVEPAEEGALPEQSVLRLDDPVRLVGVDEQLGRDAAELGSIEGSHPLIGQDAVVTLAVDDEDKVRCATALPLSQGAPPISQLANHISSVHIY